MAFLGSTPASVSSDTSHFWAVRQGLKVIRDLEPHVSQDQPSGLYRSSQQLCSQQTPRHRYLPTIATSYMFAGV